MRALNHIHTEQWLKKKQASERANAYNKANPERHRKNNREWARKNYKKKEVK